MTFDDSIVARGREMNLGQIQMGSQRLRSMSVGFNPQRYMSQRVGLGASSQRQSIIRRRAFVLNSHRDNAAVDEYQIHE